MAKVVEALPCLCRHFTAEDPSTVWIQIPQHPMGEGSPRGIGILAGEAERESARGHTPPVQLRG
jgi:hypothetical protein